MRRASVVLSTCVLWLASAVAQSPAPPIGNTSQDFGGIRTFLRAPHVKDIAALEADIAVIGMPFDQGTSNRPGQRYGPRDIREASLIYAWAPQNGFYYIDTERIVLKGKRWADLGDVDVVPSDTPRTSRNLTAAVAAILERHALPVILGGDHSITFPAVRAFKLPALTIVHFDAHLDSYGTGDPNVLNHGGWVQQVKRLPGVRIIQLGMRGIANDAVGVEAAHRLGSTIFTAERVHREGARAILQSLPRLDQIYVSIDIDVLDPSLAPGTGTVEVGGLTFHQLHELLIGLPAKGRVVGLDVVEVNPLFDPTGVTAQTAARLVIDLVGAAFENRD